LDLPVLFVVIEFFLYSLVCLSWLWTCICSRPVKGECNLYSCYLPLTAIKSEYTITVLRQADRYRKSGWQKERSSHFKSGKWTVPFPHLMNVYSYVNGQWPCFLFEMRSECSAQHSF